MTADDCSILDIHRLPCGVRIVVTQFEIRVLTMINRARALAFLCAVVSIAAAPNVMAAPDSEQEPGSVSLVENNGKFTLQNNLGHSFYTYDKDEKNKSNCVDECTQNWGPAIAGVHAKPLGEWTLVDRGGGHMQWAYEGKLIYSNRMESESGVALRLPANSPWHV